MSRKVSVDEEIEQLEQSLISQENIHPDYTPPELKKLQGVVLAVHAHLENALGTRILLQIRKAVGVTSEESWNQIVSTIKPMLENISYRNKVDIVESYGDETSGLIRILKKVNTYRVEFAHPKGFTLRSKYDKYDYRGKINLRDLLRCLNQAKKDMDNYFIKVEGVPKFNENLAQKY